MRDITIKLKSQNAVVSVLVLALLAQMPHAQHVFFANNHDTGWFGWVQSWGGAIALEVAVLVFVIRGNTKVSWGFAAFSVAVNLMYYYDVTLSPWLSPVLLSVGLPLAIALYSHEVADKHEAQPTDAINTQSTRNQTQSDAISPLTALAPSQPVARDDATTQPEPQSDAIDAQVVAQLDEMNERIVASIRNGNYTPYAISKDTGITLTTLKRKKAKDSDEYTGRIPQLVAAGLLHNSSGDDGNEYRLVE